MASTAQLIPDGELPGETMTRDHAAIHDPRDVIGPDRRVAEHDRTCRLRSYADASMLGWDFEIQLFGGEKEAGKTLMAVERARQFYLRGGYVFHNTSLTFGKRLTGIEIITFAAEIPHHSMVVVDEAHVMFEAVTSAKIRLVLNGFSILRHIGCEIVLISTSERQIHPAVLAEVRTVLYPKLPRYHISDPWPPMWCHKTADLVGPFPFKHHSRIGDQYGVGRKRKSRRWPMIPSPSPYEIWRSAHLYDSWAEPDLAEGMHTTVDVLRKATDPKSGSYDLQADADAFYASIDAQLDSGVTLGKRLVPWEFIVQLARDGGWEPPASIPDQRGKEGLSIIKAFLPLSSMYRVPPDELLALLGRDGSK